jgi:hypothetical protein
MFVFHNLSVTLANRMLYHTTALHLALEAPATQWISRSACLCFHLHSHRMMSFVTECWRADGVTGAVEQEWPKFFVQWRWQQLWQWHIAGKVTWHTGCICQYEFRDSTLKQATAEAFQIRTFSPSWSSSHPIRRDITSAFQIESLCNVKIH